MKIEKMAGPPSIFVIDDEEPITMILRSILTKNFSYSIEIANSFAEAEKLVNNNTPVIAFIDINLGDGNGYNLIPSIKRNNNPDTKIIMMSAYATDGEYSIAINNGADYFIAKPFDKNSIIETVNLFI